MADQASGSITINADKGDILAVIADFEAYPEWAKAVKKAEVLDEGSDGWARRVRFVMDAGIIKDEYVLDYDWADDSVSWTLVESKAMKSQEGSYTLTGDDGDVQVTYDLSLDLKISVPGILKRRGEKQVIDTALKELKRRVEG